jgi:hypothetical protein
MMTVWEYGYWVNMHGDGVALIVVMLLRVFANMRVRRMWGMNVIHVIFYCISTF